MSVTNDRVREPRSARDHMDSARVELERARSSSGVEQLSGEAAHLGYAQVEATLAVAQSLSVLVRSLERRGALGG